MEVTVDKDSYDVILVGYGPGGQALAALLGQLGDRVLVVERRSQLYNLPRAGHIDHEVVRIVQAVGRADDLEPKLWPVSGDYVYVNGQYEVLMSHPIDVQTMSVSGWHSDYTLYQPVLEDAFHSAVTAAGVELAMGWDVVDVGQETEFVVAHLQRVEYVDGNRQPTDEFRTVRAKYLIGADGASSSIRRRLGIGQQDLGFDEKFLDVDMENIQPLTFEPNMAQVCDPARPRMLIPMGPLHRRFEWALRPGESVQEMERPETAWQLLKEWHVTPDTHRIVRQIVYTFQARVANTWRSGRVLLVGDAAHTMPPFAGQGLCSAVRDAANLAWKLHLVLRGVAPGSLLDTYEAERRPHVLAWTAISIAEGKINCEWDENLAAERDRRFRDGWRPPVDDLPKLGSSVLLPSLAHPAAGQLCPQAVVRFGNRSARLEDLIPPYRFNLIIFDGDPDPYLDDRHRRILNELGANIVRICRAGEFAPGCFEDVTRTYENWFKANGLRVLLERPDFYIYEVSDDISSVNDLIDRLEMAVTRATTVNT